MCVYRKNQEQEPNTKPSPAQRLPSPTPFSKNNQEKKFIKISCRNSLKFTVACRHCTHRPAPQCPIGCVLRAPGPRPTLPETDRQTDRRQEDAAAAPSLNREVKKLNKLKQQINNTDLGQPAASGSSSTRARTGTQAREHLQRRAGGTGCQLASAWVPRCRWTGEGVLQKEGAEERLQAPSARLSDASPTTAPPWRQPRRQDLPRALVTASLSAASPRSQVLLPMAMRSRNRAECHAGRWTEAVAVGRASPPGTPQQQERRGRSTAAAFSGPVSGAEPRGRPRGGDMLTFRDNSWYQSGNSDVVRDRQREKQREKERAGTGGPATGPGPRCPYPFLPRFTPV